MSFRRSFLRRFALIVVASVSFSSFAADVRPSSSDQNEYSGALSHPRIADRITALEIFATNHRSSPLAEDALQFALWYYVSTGGRARTLDVAAQLLRVNPDNPLALAVLGHDRRSAAEGGLDAERNLREADRMTNDGLKALNYMRHPQGMTDADFVAMKRQVIALLEGDAGYIALQNKRYPQAQLLLKNAVDADPESPQNVYALSLSYLNAPRPDRKEGYFYLARTVNLTQGTPAGEQIANFAADLYRKDGGTPQNWNQFLVATRVPNPPATAPPAQVEVARATPPPQPVVSAPAQPAPARTVPAPAPATTVPPTTTPATTTAATTTPTPPATTTAQSSTTVARTPPATAAPTRPAQAATMPPSTAAASAPPVQSPTATQTQPQPVQTASAQPAPTLPVLPATTSRAGTPSTVPQSESAPAPAPSTPAAPVQQQADNRASQNAGQPISPSNTQSATQANDKAGQQTIARADIPRDVTSTVPPEPPPPEKGRSKIDYNSGIWKSPSADTPPAPGPIYKRPANGSPVSLGILIESAHLTKGEREALVRGITNILDDLRPSDEAFILTYGDELTFEQDLTHQPWLLQDAMSHLKPHGGDQALYDAIATSAAHLRRIAKNQNRVLLLVSDGENSTKNKRGLDLGWSVREVTVHCMGVDVASDTERRFLEALASRTGGHTVFVHDVQEFPAMSQQMARNIYGGP